MPDALIVNRGPHAELVYRTAGECLDLLRRRILGSAELVEACLSRIEAVNPKLNAVVCTAFEQARDRARAADEARCRGEDWGPLFGLPVTIKDSLETADMVTTGGSPSLRNHRPSKNADVVQRILDAGAIPLGKTNLPIHAGDWQTYNAVYGRTNNPWDVGRTVGGSSGGSAASIAAGFAPLEFGSDIAGSIRIPAHYCGVYGHKPSYGIVPGRGHIPGPPGSLARPDLAVIGPLARSAGDLRLALDQIVGLEQIDRDG